MILARLVTFSTVTEISEGKCRVFLQLSDDRVTMTPSYELTLSQTTNFRLFQTVRVCRQ